MPAITELSTVEWQRAHVTPSRVIVRVHGRLNTDDRVHLEQRDGRRRALEIDLVQDPGRQRVGVHFEAHLERGHWVDVLFDDLVQPKRVGPELFVAKRVEAENA
jgi:hypothetical protein